MIRILILAAWVLAAGSLFAEETTSRTQVVVVVGAEGTPDFGEQFAAWADNWKTVAEKADADLSVIGQSDPGDVNDREQLKTKIESLPADGARPVWMLFIGHGTFSRQAAKFNLRGPDVSAKDLADWIKPIRRPLVIVNCASSSSPFINKLSGPNRVIVTATKSGSQYNFSRFGKYFANAIASIESDLDHDDEVSVHEAFLRASSEVRDFYIAEASIATENALIDDNGDGRGTPAKMFRGVRAISKAKDGAKLDGAFAMRISLSPTGNRLKLTDDQIKQRDALEQELDSVRVKKDKMTEAEYDEAIEPIILKLAKIYQAAEQK